AATKSPMRRDLYFRIGSNTKTFTITVLLQLAGEKKLNLDDPVSKYAPFVPNGSHITLRMLANMTSGLFNYTEDETFVKQLLVDPDRVYSPRQLVDIGLAHKPYFAPNTGWHYSNTNTVLLGTIIEQVTGRKIGDVFAERLFKPLGLENTIWPANGTMPEPYANGITEQTPGGRPADATHWNPSWAFTAGALISTLDDMRTWVDSYTAGSLISPAMQQERLTWVTLPPNTPVRKYGLGIGVDHGWLGHTGELPGYNTAGYRFQPKNITVVIMVNSDISKQNVNPAPALFKAIAKILTPNNIPT
ncbi:MAG: serine hydrolase domain-containing protein, partial [Candidatus Baltobacteraceae bacterium]